MWGFARLSHWAGHPHAIYFWTIVTIAMCHIERKYCNIVLSMLEECGKGPGQDAQSFNIAIAACSRASQWAKAMRGMAVPSTFFFGVCVCVCWDFIWHASPLLIGFWVLLASHSGIASRPKRKLGARCSAPVRKPGCLKRLLDSYCSSFDSGGL